MKTLKFWSPLLSSLIGLATASSVCADAQGGPYSITKDLWGASGSAYVSAGPYTMGYSAGEQTAGYDPSNGAVDVVTGYYGGRLGNWMTFGASRVQAEAIGPMTSGVQLGVPINGSIEINLTDQAQSLTLASGIHLYTQQDHLGNPQNNSANFQWTYTPSGQTIILSSSGPWSGNTLYDVAITSGLLNLDGIPLSQETHFRFMTVLDPRQENVVLGSVDAGAQAPNKAPAQAGSTGGSLRVQIAPGAMSNFSVVLLNQDPMRSPLRIDPSIIRDANQKAISSSGGYQTPLALQEIVALGVQGEQFTTLSAPAEISWPYQAQNGITNAMSPPVRSSTLALWALDTEHHLWVKMPASSQNGQFSAVSAPITRFSVFALMGSADGSASDVFVFPIPWRPHGPNAGSGSGQTGTEQAGMTFSNLPSECTIRIYTLNGEKVRELHHSDTQGLIGQERWDGLTEHGEHAASGVYLWRAESSRDGKNGKLMVIR